MKIYISADIEGVAGVVIPQQCSSGNAEYERARRLMTNEVNAAVTGAFEAGAKEVVVNDSHGAMVNLVPELLHPDAELIQGKPKPQNMACGLADGGFDMVFLVGHHAGASLEGVLAHTTNSRAFRAVYLGDKRLGEPGIYGAYAGELGIPVGLLTGDNCLEEQNREFFPKARFATVKHAYANRAARSLSPKKSCEKIKAAAFEAVKNRHEMKPFIIRPPFMVKFEVLWPALADQAAHLPPAKRIDAVTIGFDCNSVRDAIGWMSAVSALAASVM
ncbi:D-aminopeptidase [Bartonella apihabitans]|uniref:M55 family metallopeptidase n=1 Tax=Bartonella apihabitans TaxID=2750929 RepID=UPI003997E9CF